MAIDPSSFGVADPTGTQKLLTALWVEVLQLSRPPTETDDFFALGGTSMTMITLEYRIEEEFNVQLSAGTLLGVPTLGELSNVVESLRASAR